MVALIVGAVLSGACVVSVLASLAARRWGRVTVVGVVEQVSGSGTADVLHAPVSGVECVWYAARIIERWREFDRVHVRDFDGDGRRDRRQIRRARRRQRRQTHLHASRRMFVVRDARGSVLVDPARLRPSQVGAPVRDTVGPEADGVLPRLVLPIASAGWGLPPGDVVRGPSMFDREESLLVVGQRVSVTGRAVRRGDGTVLLHARRVRSVQAAVPRVNGSSSPGAAA